MEKKNQLKSCLTSPLAGSCGRRKGEGDIKEKSYFTPSSVCSDFARQTTSPARGEVKQLGFTLIELLVVVLIIGILAAVALPQYQKAVWKSRNTQLKQLVKAVAQAEEAYYMANGKYAANFDELSIDLPLTAVTTPANGTYGACGTNTRGTDAARQGKNFYIALNTSDSTLSGMSVVAYYDDGPYKCAGFGYGFYANSAPETEGIGLHCREPKFTSLYTAGTGAFCEKIERGALTYQSDSWRWYALP